ncbi:MAG: tetratricopeptide repeat protein [Bacteroidota bacterium]
MPTYRLLPLGLVLVGFLLTGCVSTQKRYERGVELEAQGRYADAAEYYIKVLEKEPTWAEVQDRLQDVGDQAVADLIEAARGAERTGAFDEAIGYVRSVDNLSNEARSVGVTLALPESYDGFRGNLLEQAIAANVRTGERAERRGEWDKALKAYRKALDDYPVSFAQRSQLIGAQVRVHTAWARQEMERGRYRAAFERAQDAVDLLPIDHPDTAAPLRVQDEALEAGTQVVAFLPFWQIDAYQRTAPAGLLQAFNDELVLDHWTNPPPFIASVDPVEVRREVRRLRYDRALVTRTQAIEIGRAVESDFVVAGEMLSFLREEKRPRERTREARTRGRNALDTSFVAIEYTAEITAEVEIHIYDADTRRVVREEKVREKTSQRLERGSYPGDWRDLDLSGSERRLFDPDEQAELERELENELVDKLGERVVEIVFDTLVRQID